MTAAGEVYFQQVRFGDGTVYWVQIRPQEGGRYALCRHAHGRTEDVVPTGFSVRTRAHEYGGGSWVLGEQGVFFSNFADQRLYRQDAREQPRPITPEPAVQGGLRYADGRLTPDGRWLVCVQEEHRPDGTIENGLVVISPDGSQPVRLLAGGHDFYSNPRLSPDGRSLCWLSWDHPCLPWDGTEVWIAEFLPNGTLRGEHRLLGGPQESVFQPEWDPAGRLHFISDRSGWWNLYRWTDDEAHSLAPMEADFAFPQWQFGYARYAFLSGGRIACVFSQGGFDHLGVIRPGTRAVEEIDLGLTSFYYPHLVSNGDDSLCFIGGSPTQPMSVMRLDVSSRRLEVIHQAPGQDIDARSLSTPRAIEFPTEGGRTAHALFYPPRNADFHAAQDERPPLIVISHGGPTSAARSYLDLRIQFFTSRGLAVVDVNYGGSTGYGRAYRERLKGQWGVVDVADCVHAARYLASAGEVDGRRMAIRGGSAGGYTTFCALTFYTDFAAGVSYYGVADLETFVTDTHKFESRYLDSLVGPYPERKDLYHARSPAHFADRITCPLLLFQGLDDKIVPPSQTEAMLRALRAKGLPHAYLTFEGESHGFRRSETIQRCFEAELDFYGRIFGFSPADDVEGIPLENLPPK
jgi:dipeptidyl aminopeptidase/acylaminoacyl peptidase